MSCPLATEKIWIEKSKYDDAEKNYFERLSKLLKVSKVEIPEEEPNKESKNMAKSKPKVGSSAKSSPDNKISENIVETEPNTTKGNKTQKQKKGKIDKELATSGNNKVAQEAPVIKYEEISGNKPTETVSNPEEPKVKKNKKKKKNNSIKDDRSSQENSVTRSSNTFETDIQESKENIEPVDDEAKKKRKDRHRDNKNNKISGSGQCTLVSEIAKARQHIKNSLEKMNDIAALAATPGGDVIERLNALEKDNASLRELVETLKNCFTSSENRIKTLEARIQKLSVSSKPTGTASVTASKKVSESKNDDDDVDLFGSESEEEDEAAAKVREQRLAEYAAKKSKKPALIAKSSLVLDVKPWDDETDLNVMEKEIRKIVTDGLLWGASKFLPVAFGINKLSISCVVEDDKVSIDWLTEEIEKLEEYVQSVDVAAFNKI